MVLFKNKNYYLLWLVIIAKVAYADVYIICLREGIYNHEATISVQAVIWCNIPEIAAFYKEVIIASFQAIKYNHEVAILKLYIA